MRRRTLLQSLIVFLSLWPLIATAQRRKAPSHVLHSPEDVVIDQSGVIGNGVFVVGAFTCTDTAGFAKAALNLRRRMGYRTTLTHASRDKWKGPYARALIDLWLATPGARMDVIVVRAGSIPSSATSSEKLNQHVEVVSRLIDGSPKTTGLKRRLVVQTHYRKHRQTTFEKALNARTTRVARTVHVQERDSDLLQLVDLVVGAIQASQPRSKDAIKNKIKLQTIAHLETVLGVPNLSAPVRNQQFSITFV